MSPVEKLTVAKAINNGLRRALETDPKVVLMGEDIGRLGGVFRVTEGLQKDFGAERERLLDVVRAARARGVKCDVEVLQEGHSAATDADGDLGRALSSSIRGVTRGQGRFELCPGVLETRHYAALGIPALAYGPGLLSVAHGPHEFVSIPKLVQCAEVYARTALKLLS